MTAWQKSSTTNHSTAQEWEHSIKVMTTANMTVFKVYFKKQRLYLTIFLWQVFSFQFTQRNSEEMRKNIVMCENAKKLS